MKRNKLGVRIFKYTKRYVKDGIEHGITVSNNIIIERVINFNNFGIRILKKINKKHEKDSSSIFKRK